jgi:hypothetical protein
MTTMVRADFEGFAVEVGTMPAWVHPVFADIAPEVMRLAWVRVTGRQKGRRRAARRRQRGRGAALRCRVTKHLHRLGWRPEAAVESERRRMRRDEVTTEHALTYMHRVCRW